MTKNNHHNDEELYRQFMDELEPGANKYDRMMEEHTAPAYRAKNAARHLRLYAVAACLAGLLIVGYATLFRHAYNDRTTGYTTQTTGNTTQTSFSPTLPPAAQRKKSADDVNTATAEVKKTPAQHAEDYVCHIGTIVIPISDKASAGHVQADGETAMTADGLYEDIKDIVPGQEPDSIVAGGPSATALYCMSRYED